MYEINQIYIVRSKIKWVAHLWTIFVPSVVKSGGVDSIARPAAQQSNTLPLDHGNVSPVLIHCGSSRYFTHDMFGWNRIVFWFTLHIAKVPCVQFTIVIGVTCSVPSRYLNQWWPSSLVEICVPASVLIIHYVWLRHGTGTRPTNDISIEFEIQWKFVLLLFVTYSADHNQIMHTSRQCNCRDVCKISLWSLEHILNQSIPNFDRFSNFSLPEWSQERLG